MRGAMPTHLGANPRNHVNHDSCSSLENFYYYLITYYLHSFEGTCVIVCNCKSICNNCKSFENLLYILERVNKTDLEQNIFNLTETNKDETGQKQKFGTSIITSISQMIDNKKFNDLTQYILNTIDTPENIKVMSEWT